MLPHILKLCLYMCKWIPSPPLANGSHKGPVAAQCGSPTHSACAWRSPLHSLPYRADPDGRFPIGLNHLLPSKPDGAYISVYWSVRPCVSDARWVQRFHVQAHSLEVSEQELCIPAELPVPAQPITGKGWAEKKWVLASKGIGESAKTTVILNMYQMALKCSLLCIVSQA